MDSHELRVVYGIDPSVIEIMEPTIWQRIVRRVRSVLRGLGYRLKIIKY